MIDIDMEIGENYKILFHIIFNEYIDILKYLLEVNAQRKNLSIEDENNKLSLVALRYAASGGHLETSKILIELGISVVKSDAIALAAKNGCFSVFKVLMGQKKSSIINHAHALFMAIDMGMDKGKHSAMIPFHENHMKIICHLLDHCDFDERTIIRAFAKALMTGRIELVKAVIKYFKQSEASDKELGCAIRHSISSNNFKMMRLLMEKEAEFMPNKEEYKQKFSERNLNLYKRAKKYDAFFNIISFLKKTFDPNMLNQEGGSEEDESEDEFLN